MTASDNIVKKYNRDTRIIWGIVGLVAIIVIAFLSYLVAQSRETNAKLQESLNKETTIINQQLTSQSKELDAIKQNQHQTQADIACVAELFASSRPGTLTITDFDNCQTKANEANPAEATQATGGGATSTSPQSTTPTSGTSGDSGKSNNGSSGSSPNPIQNVVNTIDKAIGKLGL